MKRKFLAILTVPVIMFTLMGASCDTKQDFDNLGQPKIQFLGDSITVLATDDINAHYGPNYDVGIDATQGTTSSAELTNFANEGIKNPRYAIINIGTNDVDCTGTVGFCVAAYSESATEANFWTFFHDFPATTCVMFVTLNTHNPGFNPPASMALNNYIRSHFAHVVDWDAAWRSSYFDATNTPHPNETGKQALIALEDQAIARC